MHIDKSQLNISAPHMYCRKFCESNDFFYNIIDQFSKKNITFPHKNYNKMSFNFS